MAAISENGGGFIFHDLRHTFNTNMRKSGVDETVIMQITGHSTRDVFYRYNTVDAADVKLAIDRFSDFVTKPNVAHLLSISKKSRLKSHRNPLISLFYSSKPV